MFKSTLAMVGLALYLCGAASADTQTEIPFKKRYVEFGYQQGVAKIDGDSTEVDLDIFFGRFGRRFNPYAGFEFEVGLSDAPGDTSYGDVNRVVTVGGYGRLSLPLGDYVELTGRLGYAGFIVDSDEGTGARDSLFDDGKGLSGGVGLQVNITEKFAVRAMFTQIWDEDESQDDFETKGISAVLKF